MPLNLCCNTPRSLPGISGIPYGPADNQIIRSPSNRHSRGDNPGLVVRGDPTVNRSDAGRHRLETIAKGCLDAMDFLAGTDNSGATGVPGHGRFFHHQLLQIP